MAQHNLQGLPPHAKVIIIEDENRDYTRDKFIPELRAKDYPTFIQTKLEKDNHELKTKADEREKQLSLDIASHQKQLAEQNNIIQLLMKKAGITAEDLESSLEDSESKSDKAILPNNQDNKKAGRPKQS